MPSQTTVWSVTAGKVSDRSQTCNRNDRSVCSSVLPLHLYNTNKNITKLGKYHKYGTICSSTTKTMVATNEKLDYNQFLLYHEETLTAGTRQRS